MYINDWILWSTSHEQLKLNTSLVTKLLQLGFTVNWQKSQLTPTNTIVYLGVLWNGTAYTIIPSPQNTGKVVGLVAKVLSKGKLLTKLYQRLLETLNFIAPLVHQEKETLTSNSKCSKILTRKKSYSLYACTPFCLCGLDVLNKSCSSSVYIGSFTPTHNLVRRVKFWIGESLLSGRHSLGQWSVEGSFRHINALECFAAINSNSFLKLLPQFSFSQTIEW